MAQRPQGAPPFAQAPTAHSKSKWAQLKLQDLADIEQLIKKSEMYDPSGPTTRKRRAAHLKDFEFFCQEQLGLRDHAAIWDKATIVDNQKKYIGGVAIVAKGVINEKVKVGSLYQIKHTLYWWNARFVDSFSTIFLHWHNELMKFIHLVATHHQLPAESWKKNILTDVELCMLYQAVVQSTTSVDNSQQNYNLWLLAWGTGARPGSLVLADGYGRNDLRSDGTPRGTDDTLRWKDVEFFKKDGQVCFRLTLRFIKGHRDPYKHDYVEMSRTFLYLPDCSPSPQHELDLTLTLLGQAIKRNLFPGGLDYVLSTNDFWLKVDPVVASQPVFTGANQAGSIEVNEPMRVRVVNERLRLMLIRAGLPERNTMYCFRRARIVSTKHEYGVDAARAIAGHADQSKIHESYDTVNVADIDIQAYIRSRETISREEARKIFDQASQTLYAAASTNAKGSLQAELETRLQERESEDEECVNAAKTVKSCIDNTYDLIHSLDASTELERGYTTKYTGHYKATLRSIATPEAEQVLRALEEAVYQRKLTRKKVRSVLRKVILEEIAEETKAQLKTGMAAATKGFAIAGATSGSIRQQIAQGQKEHEASTRERLNAVHALLQEHDSTDQPSHDAAEEENIDIDAYEIQDEMRNPRGEPSHWQDFNNDGVIQIVRESEQIAEGSQDRAGTSSEQSRIDFLKSFVAHTSRQSTGLICRLCVADPTASEDAKKKKKWVLHRLKLHYKGSTHSRKPQLSSAFNTMQKALAGGDVPCPHCPSRLFRSSRSWLDHVEEYHAYELWIKNDSDEEDLEIEDDEMLLEGDDEGVGEEEAEEEEGSDENVQSLPFGGFDTETQDEDGDEEEWQGFDSDA
ncbi:hypothetical protein HBI56_019850 [Parastagonospora nodorum]|nr:hypothetical protein HBH53_002920 [Parastagonospora nodorum]KAH3982457.1 hypothetical protein HBH52_075810 [Parastagonospora nodorum]KAH4058293.1 hypothetical protein HBH49_031260 [Parastagonospora nodorum]KAH4068948.1 hypothetical protein HBH50_106830 [Parastagonospora nodorum]KAH4088016.1 hypothetical protein HBH48_123790 [Parastagonospora nodorum]